MTSRLPLAAALLLAACSGGEEASDPARSPEAAARPERPASSTPATAATPGGALTAAGWGPLRIGMARSEVVATLGPDANPGAVGGPEPELCEEFRPSRAPRDMLVMIERGRLSRISIVRNSAVRTDTGLGIGVTPADVRAIYGRRVQSSPHKYEAAPAEYLTIWDRDRFDSYVDDRAARGIRYVVDGSGKVSAIHVGGPSIQYVEGCA